MAEIPFSYHKLASRAAKYEEQACTFCNQGQVENEVHFLFDCSKYKDDRKKFFREIKEIAKMDLIHVNKINNLKNVFYQGSLKYSW